MVHLVTAVFNHSQLEAVTHALRANHADGMTVSEVRGMGSHEGKVEVYRGSECRVAFAPKIKVEVLCDLFDAERIVSAIADAARTGNPGDGIVWVSPIDRLLAIRTKGIDVDAI